MTAEMDRLRDERNEERRRAERFSRLAAAALREHFEAMDDPEIVALLAKVSEADLEDAASDYLAESDHVWDAFPRVTSPQPSWSDDCQGILELVRSRVGLPESDSR